MLPRPTYAPDLVASALVAWQKSGFAVDKLPDIESIAYRNADLERDLNSMMTVVDFHNTPRE